MCAGFRCAAAVIGLFLVVVLTREITAQPLPRPGTSVRNRRIDQNSAALLAPIPLFISGDDVYAMQRLRDYGSLTVDQAPLDDVVEQLSRQFNVTIVLDVRALEEASVTPTTLVTVRQSDVPLKSLLRQLLSPLELTWVLDEGFIQVTTQERAKTQLMTAFYPAEDLIDPAAVQSGLRNLVDAITKDVAADSWEEAGGPAYAAPIPSLDVLVVCQTQEEHDAIFAYLTQRRQNKWRPGDPVVDWDAARISALESIVRDLSQSPAPKVVLDATDAELRLHAQLDEVVTLVAEEMPLDEWVRALRQQQHLPVGLDRIALQEAAVPPNNPVSVAAHNVPLRRAFYLALQSLELAFQVRDEQILFTTTEKAKTQLEPRIYPVADLITPYDDACSVDSETLISFLYDFISPDSWEEAGGPGYILYDKASRSLTVGNTIEVHHAINDFLKAVRLSKRRLQSLQQRLHGVTPAFASTGRPAPVFPASTLKQLPVRSTTSISLRPTRHSEAVAKQLETRVSAEWHAIPFEELIHRMGQQYGVRFVWDSSLRNEEFDLQSKVSLEVHDVPLRDALRDVLAQLDLLYHVVDDIVVIGTEAMAERMMTTVAHSVRDLVARGDPDVGSRKKEYEALNEYVRSMVAPATWDQAGGPAFMEVSPTTGKLVAYQTPEAQQRIERILAMLRRAKVISDSQAQPSGASKTVSLVSQRLGTPERPRRGHKSSGAIGMGGGGFFAIEVDFTPGGSNANTAAKPDR